jgi:hypothetical protein
MAEETKAAYERLAQAITDVARLEDAEGILTEWVIVASFQRFEDNEQRDQILRLLPASQVPYHRVMGLLDYATALYRHEITHD